MEHKFIKVNNLSDKKVQHNFYLLRVSMNLFFTFTGLLQNKSDLWKR